MINYLHAPLVNFLATSRFDVKALIFLCLIFNAGCVSTPSKQFDQYAASAGLLKSTINTEKFSLAVYQNVPQEPNPDSTLHIYLGGDGTPWITPSYKSIDPTPRKYTALDLMLLDQKSSIYIGRPCYHGFASDPECEPKWWTSHRYSSEVIAALVEAINSVQQPRRQLTLIGFSGGGTLAMLVAPYLLNSDGDTTVNSVVTISANLDIQHWTSGHNYSPLYGSLNPIQQADLDISIEQHHLLGELDANIDASHLIEKLSGRPSTTVQLFNNFDHHCCWSEIWPEFITNLE